MKKAITVTLRIKCLLCITGGLILLGLTAALAYADTNVLDDVVRIASCMGD